MTDWKTDHANEAEKLIYGEDGKLDPLIVDVLEEFAMNMKFEFKGLPRYGLIKIVTYAAQVCLARMKGFDPNLLTLTEEEATEQQMMLIKMAMEAKVPTFVVEVQE